MTDNEKKETIPDQPAVMSWVDFLQEQPPGSVITVANAIHQIKSQWGTNTEIVVPELQLFCPEPTCNGYMFFTSEDKEKWVSKDKWTKTFLTYWCRHCQRYSKMFALALQPKDKDQCDAYKFGELPGFGPPIPSRALRLIQPDRELFLSGRRCENQGLGIGAFTYYRRVVENQWGRLIGEIIKVAKAINAPQATISALEAATTEQQFSKTVKGLKDAVPQTLLINGHNPLILLHAALSNGVHNLPDKECLELATSIRVVLVELAEKLGQALKDEKELSDAVAKLLQGQSSKKPNE